MRRGEKSYPSITVEDREGEDEAVAGTVVVLVAE